MSTPIIPQERLDYYLNHYTKEKDHGVYQRIEADRVRITAEILSDIRPSEHQPFAITTTGGENSGKDTLLADMVGKLSNTALISPKRILQTMDCYRSDVGGGIDEDVMIYNRNVANVKWLPAAKYIAATIINYCGREGISFGARFTGDAPQGYELFDNLHEKGFFIDHHHCEAGMDVQFASATIGAQLYHMPQPEPLLILSKNLATHAHSALIAERVDRLTLYTRVVEPYVPVVTVQDGKQVELPEQNPVARLAKAQLKLVVSSDGQVGEPRAKIVFDSLRHDDNCTADALMAIHARRSRLPAARAAVA